ncbi:hypothetical protein GCM10009347_38650 [Shewanella algicola]|uniref:Uncharacterized protein n=1 Tax=Shewanella algicola TaxID=640633 RepID=A0A9X1Z703_9GAMM|nr:hypothetical protein [Shewanella algicola]MCL1107506.1 hypothetical protein [Shewanella algicola]GGP69723.1 hypothetical protein GCM10009347_38650 [Shewanella algicola]
MNPSIMITETVSYWMPFISIGIVIVGGLCMGIYHIATFNDEKAKEKSKDHN